MDGTSTSPIEFKHTEYYEQYRRLFGQVIKFHEGGHAGRREGDDFLSGLDADAFMQQFDDEGKDDIFVDTLSDEAFGIHVGNGEK